MKIVTWLGTRPEIIRLSRIIPLLDAHAEHSVVHTGQNYDETLSDIFFRDLGVRAPDEHLGIVASSFGVQAGAIIEKSFEYFSRVRPDRVLILGDTNSGLAAVSAARLQIPVYHMEAGNRCHDDRVPEEINRRVIDHCSAMLLPYTHRSKENLVREGIEPRRISVIGNPIHEVIEHYRTRIEASDAASRLGVDRGRYFLATLHRAENVDEAERLRSFMTALERVTSEHSLPVIVSVHPRTAERLGALGMKFGERVRLLRPLGFFDFVHLELHAACVLTDSGTVQEECCIYGIPNVTLRDVTERPETIDCGSNILTGADPDRISKAAALAMSRRPWAVPEEYVRPNVSQTVAKILLGFTL